MRHPASRLLRAALLVSTVGTLTGGALAGAPQTPVYGPYNGTFINGGLGLTKVTGAADDALLAAGHAWTLSAWVRLDDAVTTHVLIGGIGDPTRPYARHLAVSGGHLALWQGTGALLESGTALAPGGWHLAAASSDGRTVRLFLDGREVASGTAASGGTADPVAEIAPAKQPWPDAVHFSGKIAELGLLDHAVDAATLKAQAQTPPDPSLIVFEEGSKPWPVQYKSWPGLTAPQDPASLPHSATPPSAPRAVPVASGPTLVARGTGVWTLAHGWRLIDAPHVRADGRGLSTPGFDAKSWYAATVPGTVLTTLIDRGVYPDPDYGLNNMAIPESLARQDYWYRVEFPTPDMAAGRRLALSFKGINYAAEVWLNGERLGDITGAFIRGDFDISGRLRPGQSNALAVRISPPPHPGIPHEQSLKAGPGENGGAQLLDGPTFVATEGWDWMPGIRDRDSGIWQDVELTATGPVRLGDAQVVTTLPLPDTSRADVDIRVPLRNPGPAPVQATLTAAFDDVSVSKTVTVAPGDTLVDLNPRDFHQLTVAHPRLWWPNGYGDPALHTLHLSVSTGDGVSDQHDVRFGIREISYELSLVDAAGHLRRMEIDPAKDPGHNPVDGSHEGIRQVAKAWAVSLRPGAERSPAVKALPDSPLAPFLVFKVNGVRIAARGGAWGMDDTRKRVSRARLEPYFRLHRDANVNIIRNWVGQDTEETFFDLADEYGLLVWNDFWESTQDFNLEAQDVDLFLKNARDVVARYRNHPSIALWVGRNEGVPQPILNEALERMTTEVDGTRYYAGASNRVNLWDSGPYNYQPPARYFTGLSEGFAVEVGTPSFPTLESFEAMTPEADRWPINDTWAYHDWHQGGNGDVATFMATLDKEFGAATSLADFERKTQMMNYVTHRAIFEGFNAGLWTRNSGRMLWMTQPAWPSTVWQILSSDYDTGGAYYGVKKASEPLHVQMNLPDFQVVVTNTTRTARPALTVRARVYDLDNRPLLDRAAVITAAANATTDALAPLDLKPLMGEDRVVLVKLDLTDADGQVLSDNFYWQGAEDKSYRRLNDLKLQDVTATATGGVEGGDGMVTVTLSNQGAQAALANKLTLEDASGARVLPAYPSDNYVSLLPGESRRITIRYPAGAVPAKVALRGWNTRPLTAPVTPGA